MTPAAEVAVSKLNTGDVPRGRALTYKICITAAGVGTRNPYARFSNKILLPVANRSTFSHILGKFPQAIEVVVAVGHRAQLVKDFASLAFPDRNIVFVDVEPYEGAGSGPGYSLLSCRRLLQCPFIFIACDTLVDEDIPAPSSNWIGVSPVQDSQPYLVADVANGKVERLYDKYDVEQIRRLSPTPDVVLDNGFIGLAGVMDYETFWHGLETDDTVVQGERQVSAGLNALIPLKLGTVPFSWRDVGNGEGYQKVNEEMTGGQALIKPGEFTYIEGDKVIKFFETRERVSSRVERAKLLGAVMPEVLGATDHFLAYRYVEGRNLGDVVEPATFSAFLDFMKGHVWKPKTLNVEEQAEFVAACRRFYYDKTRERIRQFFDNTGVQDKDDTINGMSVPTIGVMFEALDWEWLCDGNPVHFHGDPQPENVIVAEDGRFFPIDWREDFGGIQQYGDIYYDLAKIYHALSVSGEIVRGNQYTVECGSDSISYNFHVKNNLLEFRSILEGFVVEQGYDLQRVRVLSAIIYLNIASLHHQPYSYLLYYLGKHLLHQLLEEKR